ncbi:thiazolinyl imide reductase [Amycolatopsis orientalis]|uniref:Thiazolinyl imide reductase n=1 Tax=Amycolatopsis orientalis TaxID=31958 RepID=A0A193BUR5_AMYOR|nr:Gfo/Idh/MocA family oxidoreductase [Amycolatopsis orientalis]ANN15961.1 thiazolinyl imide reductase [Amycolatopsis orientalis]
MTRVVVAGTSFGRIYLEAVVGAPDFTLAGVLARGSDHSRACAVRYDVPLFGSAEEVPDDVEIACVVVRSGALGGPGTGLAQAFLRRGVHVLQEHPVHADEIAANLRVARAGDAAYAVNTLYPNLRPVRRFLAAVGVLRSRQRLDFIDAACNSQVAYPLLDVLGRMTGGLRPWTFGDVHVARRQPFVSLHAEVGGVPVTVRVQNQVHPGDPDNHSHLFHRISVGCEGGVLTLADTHGPVLWNPRLHSPRDETGRLVMAGPGTERLDVPSTVVVGDEPPGTYHQVFADLWPDAVARSLRNLRQDATEPGRRMAEGQWALGVSRMWSDLTARIGLPELVEPPEPEPIPLADLLGSKGPA